MLLKEILEVRDNGHHANVQGVYSRLYGALVGTCRLLSHLFYSSFSFLLIDLDLSKGIFDLNVQLRDLIFF